MKRLSLLLESIVFFLTSLLTFLSLISYNPEDIPFLASGFSPGVSNLIGVGGAHLAFFLFFMFGWAAYFIPFFLLFSGLGKLGLLRFCGLSKSKVINVLSFLLFMVFLSGFISLFRASAGDVEMFQAGGLGFFLSEFFKKYLGVYGAFITFLLLMMVNAVLFFGFFFVDSFRGVKSLFFRSIEFIKDRKERKNVETQSLGLTRKQKEIKGNSRKNLKELKPEIKVYAPKFNHSPKNNSELPLDSFEEQAISKEQAKEKINDLEAKPAHPFDSRNYKIPNSSIVKIPPFSDQKETKENIEGKIKQLENALADFGVEAKVVRVQKGPVVTMYELEPQSGTKINRISSLADDIALSMKSSLVRVVAPIPGRGTIGVEIPNSIKQMVFLREVLEEKVFTEPKSKLTVIIGKDVSGNPVVADLGDMPHLLIAGATGAGKTVCVNSLISSILFKAKPDEVQFIMVDPKMVELASFAGIPHLIHPIISDSKKAFFALNWAAEEMGRRYKILAAAGCRNISLYNGKGNKMPYIVIIVDELADLMIVARDSIETTIQRLAQLSRAVGIHLVLATQRPSVDVITGVIKANFPARISFKVASKVDSRTVLDVMGAEKLLGKGDLLFLKPGAIKLIRAQGSYIDDEDIESLANFAREQGGPVYEKAIAEGEKKQLLDMGSDELFDDAVKIILNTRQASASLLQRRMRVGYTRAARLLDLMEQADIVGPFCGSKAREILVDPQGFLAERGLE